MTQVALRVHKKELMRETPNFARRKFLYHLSRADYERNWGKSYEKAGFGVRFVAVLLRFVPKVGPFKALGFNNPTPQTEDLYIKSINTTVDDYRALLEQTRAGKLELLNFDLDSGQLATAAEYSLSDDTYATLLGRLAKNKFDETSPELRSNVLAFYSDLSLPIATKKDPARWQEVLTDLSQLQSAPPAAPAAVVPAP
jgi:hypothetical protein